MSDKKNLIDPTLCSAKVTAEIFGCTPQHLGNLKRKGEIKQTGRGKYDLREVATYMLQANTADMSDLQKAKLDSEQQKARRQKLQNDEAAGDLIRSSEVAEFLHGYTSEMLNFYEGAKKSTGAELDNDTRKKFFKKLDDGRTAMARKLQAWVADSLGTDSAK